MPCLWCCEWELLEAAHIIPYDICNMNIKFHNKYTSSNGITLCVLHHKLFDLGYFTFADNWLLHFSNKFYEIKDKFIID